MSSKRHPLWAELIQLVPIVSLALPFIVAGKVDLSRAGTGLIVGAILTVPVIALVLRKRAVLNPILVGTDLWLWVAALAFLVPVPAVRDAVIQAQGFGLFVGVLVAALVTLVGSPQGFIGCRHEDPGFIRKASLGLFGLLLVVLVWSWTHRQDIRLGGGLPFIVLNLARRVIVRRGTS